MNLLASPVSQRNLKNSAALIRRLGYIVVLGLISMSEILQRSEGENGAETNEADTLMGSVTLSFLIVH